jgi:hypothetical protein
MVSTIELSGILEANIIAVATMLLDTRLMIVFLLEKPFNIKIIEAKITETTSIEANCGRFKK